MTLIWFMLVFVTVFDTTVASDDVCIAIFIRNKAHVLPYMLGALERLSYPKQQITLWIILDHSVDDSAAVTLAWVNKNRNFYKQVNYGVDEQSKSYPTERNEIDWTTERLEHLIELKSAVFDYAQQIKAGYLFYLDADCILTNPNTLEILISMRKPIVSPMLNSTNGFVNFLDYDPDENNFQQPTYGFDDIIQRKTTGIFQVPLVFAAVLIDMQSRLISEFTWKRKDLPYETVPANDLELFAMASDYAGVHQYLVNSHFFGYLPEPVKYEDGDDLADEVLKFRKLLTTKKACLEVDNFPTPAEGQIIAYESVGVDEIFIINLDRRPEKMQQMSRIMRLFNLKFQRFPAVDGNQLDVDTLQKLGVKMLPRYLDHVEKRVLKLGEIGHFLSHYNIWKQLLESNYDRILVLEDNVLLKPEFNLELERSLKEADLVKPNWDFLYLGRLYMSMADKLIENSSRLVVPSYSHWTLGYVLTKSGAKKLIDAKPLSKMIKLDEFLTILFDKSPRRDWYSVFPKRNVHPLSVDPLLIEPLLDEGDSRYFSDISNSQLYQTVKLQKTNPRGESYEL